MVNLSVLRCVCVLSLCLLLAQGGEGRMFQVSQCHPANLPNLPQRIQRICTQLLVTMEELQGAGDSEEDPWGGDELRRAGESRGRRSNLTTSSSGLAGAE